MFYDRTKIYVKAGDGGNGMVSFRREKYVPEGGPNGGDGGKGGNIYIQGDNNLTTMIDFKYKKNYKADKGDNGKSSNMHGRNASDRIIKVPLGTMVKDEFNEVIADIVEDGQKLLVAQGGHGGRGNARFMTNKNKEPKFAENGAPGEELWLNLELKLIADVGIAGYPNAGKSTLISSVSKARPKIANYPFTTLEPHLGVVELGDDSFVLADIPGLIDGASQGVGLGHDFLKHLERTKLIIHLIDGDSFDRSIYEEYKNINMELSLFNKELRDKKQIIAINKIDIPGVEERADEFIEKMKSEGYTDEIYKISAAARIGLDPLMYKTLELVRTTQKPAIFKEEHRVVTLKEKPLKIEIIDGGYEVTGDDVFRVFKMAYLDSDEGVMRFHRALVSIGVDALLKEKGIEDGDTVRIYDTEFDYVV
ncbi:MAG: GTPase ObgE [Firmicutes bacterium]|nr:GTPase ObgE [Bacillota bacterium]